MKRLLGLLLVAGLAPATGYAQNYFGPRLHLLLNMGLMHVSRYAADPARAPVTQRPLSIGLQCGADQPVVRFSDHQALGVSVSAGIDVAASFRFDEKSLPSRLLFSVPGFVTWRYGAGATRQASQRHGVGAGIGYRFGYVLMPRYYCPVAMLEYDYDQIDSQFFLRFITDLRSVTYQPPTTGTATGTATGYTQVQTWQLTVGHSL